MSENPKNTSEKAKKSSENLKITPNNKNIFNTTVAIKNETE